MENLSYDEFLEIKYDFTYPSPLMSAGYDQEPLLTQDPREYENLSEAITALNNWNRSTNIENEVAPLFLLAKEYLRQAHLNEHDIIEETYIEAIKKPMIN